MIPSGFYSIGFWLKIRKHDREILPCPSDSEGEVDRRRESACAGVVDAAGGGRSQGHREPAGRGRGSAKENRELHRVSEKKSAQSNHYKKVIQLP